MGSTREGGGTRKGVEKGDEREVRGYLGFVMGSFQQPVETKRTGWVSSDAIRERGREGERYLRMGALHFPKSQVNSFTQFYLIPSLTLTLNGP